MAENFGAKHEQLLTGNVLQEQTGLFAIDGFRGAAFEHAATSLGIRTDEARLRLQD